MSIRLKCVLLVSVIVVGFTQAVTAETAQTETRIDDKTFEALIRKMSPPGFASIEKKTLRELVYAKNWEPAKKLCDEIIARPIEKFPNPYYGYNLKAVAYNYKATIEQQTGGNPGIIIRNQVEAAKLGHLEAAEWLAEYLLRRQPDIVAYALNLSKQDLSNLLHVGADLGGPFSAAVIGLTSIPMEVEPKERVYWGLLAILRDKGKPRDERKEILSNTIAQLGTNTVAEVLARFSLVGYPIASSKIGIPGRGILESLFAESDLRGSMGLAFGNYRDANEKAPEAPTIREQFDFYSRLLPELTGGDVYIEVAGPSTIASPRAVSADAHNILAELIPGDRVFVGCGPLSHVAFFFRRDEAKKRLLFLDPNYEFWQPAHNSCVTSFEFVEDKHKRYLSSIPEEDAESMIEAVITLRDAR
jgi:hypothetical protein